MNTSPWQEQFFEQKVTYTLLNEGQFIIIENAPARVNPETGEQLFSPKTVEQIQQMIWDKQPPVRMIQPPVYEFGM